MSLSIYTTDNITEYNLQGLTAIKWTDIKDLKWTAGWTPVCLCQLLPHYCLCMDYVISWLVIWIMNALSLFPCAMCIDRPVSNQHGGFFFIENTLCGRVVSCCKHFIFVSSCLCSHSRAARAEPTCSTLCEYLSKRAKSLLLHLNPPV